MKRHFLVLASLCLLGMAVSVAPALANGSPSHGGGVLVQSVSNETHQSNSASALNVPILSGNNLALINTGGQSASAGTTQTQVNLNKTTQVVGQGTTCSDPGSTGFQLVGNSTSQSNDAHALNVPILSGNNLALINTGGQSASAGVTQQQANGNSTTQGVFQT